ncbi:thiamine biosynthesis protein ThiS [Flexivirga endophytica]|uniref:Thiamine biosynthesis protein ThiS n=1 Tax=Flexivirga endophytica TaxID=1849103 RepID=A0A916TG34_9MICO|nr:MoaD/ThiS family protein [Flexivirga endophytica]GGB43514.1 thiamine biosynthesis protein ThiS [Flexivirga endophytica]GHB68339.1 thiamine biosynthesis protein ThiS [Flexivirga endophytica]
MHEVTVRYWAAAQAAAGTHEERLTAADLGQLRDAALHAHPGLESVLRMSSFLLDGRRVDGSAALPADSIVEVLPPFAGG